MSVSERVEKKKEVIYFHGKDVRSKKFQKRINQKSNTSLTYALLINLIIIVVLIMMIWLVVTIIGTG